MSSLEFLSYYCFQLPDIQKSKKEDLKQAGVLGVEDVGDQVAKLFKQKNMIDLSTRLQGYQHHQDQLGKSISDFFVGRMIHFVCNMQLF